MTDVKKFPIPGSDQEDIDEALNLIWHRFERNVKSKKAIAEELNQVVNTGIFDVLLKKGYVDEQGTELVLTSTGRELAQDSIRRHRLAERLLADVLNLDMKAIDVNACQMEHVISREVSESICTLLGHPTQCPHGSAIPSGDCCRRAQRHVEPIVESVDKLTAGENGVVVYILLQDHPELHKLLSLGVIPGTGIHVHQTFPTFVLQIGENQLAMEENVAKNIFVRRQEHNRHEE